MDSPIKKEVVVNNESPRRHPRWTRQETLTLIQAKDITENGAYKGRKTGTNLVSGSSIEPKWVMISSYCKKQGVVRGAAQCRKRWSNLIGDYKKVKCWEGKDNKGESFWSMRNDLRKEKKLPVSFDLEVFKVMEGRELGRVEAVSPVSVRAVVGSGNVCFRGAEHLSKPEAEPEPESGSGSGSGEGVVLEVEVEVETETGSGDGGVSMSGPQPEAETGSGEGAEPEPDISAKGFVEESLDDVPIQHISEAMRESSWPGISYWDSQDKGKRRRLSTDDPKSSKMEEEMMKVLEANNKMVNDQLDIHNKNIQLDREQRKETTDVLVAALGKLTNVLAKIAEKL